MRTIGAAAWRRTGGWLLPVLAAAIMFAPPFASTAEAQTVQVSNVGQTRSGSLGLDTHEGAQAFTTGDNSDGYTVTSVGLDLSSGADHTINFTVGVWNSNSNLPGSSLGTLTQPASLISGVNEFTTSGITLAANTTYWVVVDSSGGGSVQWEGTASDDEDPTTPASGWSIADESYDRAHDGDTWGSYTDPFKFRVTGTAIGSITNNAPVFTEGTDTVRSVAENTASGQNIGGAVMATDTDTTDTLTYTLSGMDAADFGIVPSSGQIQTSAALNYETKDSYAVTVSVSDGNGGADSIDVTINVTDVDEPNFAPTFTEGFQRYAERRREHGIGPEHRRPRHGDGYGHDRHADLHPERDGRRRLRHRPVQRPDPDQRRAQLRDERQLCGDGFRSPTATAARIAST